MANRVEDCEGQKEESLRLVRRVEILERHELRHVGAREEMGHRVAFGEEDEADRDVHHEGGEARQDQ